MYFYVVYNTYNRKGQRQKAHFVLFDGGQTRSGQARLVLGSPPSPRDLHAVRTPCDLSPGPPGARNGPSGRTGVEITFITFGPREPLLSGRGKVRSNLFKSPIYVTYYVCK